MMDGLKRFERWYENYPLPQVEDERMSLLVKDFISHLEAAWHAGAERYIGFIVYMIEELFEKNPKLETHISLKIKPHAFKAAMMDAFKAGLENKQACSVLSANQLTSLEDLQKLFLPHP